MNQVIFKYQAYRSLFHQSSFSAKQRLDYFPYTMARLKSSDYREILWKDFVYNKFKFKKNIIFIHMLIETQIQSCNSLFLLFICNLTLILPYKSPKLLCLNVILFVRKSSKIFAVRKSSKIYKDLQFIFFWIVNIARDVIAWKECY